MKKLILIVIGLISNIIIAQNLNDYKYALVPSKFSFQKEKDKDKDKYHLNTLTKLFMEKYGFETYIESENAPYEFVNNNCNKVFVDIEKKSNMFFTKLKVILKDCNNKVLFTSNEGISKEKEYGVAYNEALRMAFASFEMLRHKYNGKIIAEKPVEVKPFKEAIEQPKVVILESKETVTTTATSNQLFAQPIQNGFQLVNTEPKVIFKLFKTSAKDFYTAIKGDLQGVLIKKNNEWFFEYYQNDKLVSEKVEVKF